MCIHGLIPEDTPRRILATDQGCEPFLSARFHLLAALRTLAAGRTFSSAFHPGGPNGLGYRNQTNKSEPCIRTRSLTSCAPRLAPLTTRLRFATFWFAAQLDSKHGLIISTEQHAYAKCPGCDDGTRLRMPAPAVAQQDCKMKREIETQIFSSPNWPCPPRTRIKIS